jgi:hypothetical protein
MEEEIEREAERLAVFQVQKYPPYYGQIPDELLKSKRVRPEAKALFGLLHKYCKGIKHLKSHPVAEVAKETLADDFGVSEDRIRIWLNELEEEGWIRVIRRGKMLVNRYVLYPRSKKTFEAWVAMNRVHLKINQDYELAKRLKESLYR